MNTQSKILAVAVIFFLSMATLANAQTEQHTDTSLPTVRILPTDAGKLKLLYVNNQNEIITVNFINDHNDVVYADQVRIRDGKGFLKFYDIDKLASGEYWIEVAGENIVTKFEVVHKHNRPLWAKYWNSYLNATSPVATK